MPKQITSFACSICKSIYDTEKEATTCENKCNKKQKIKKDENSKIEKIRDNLYKNFSALMSKQDQINLIEQTAHDLGLTSFKIHNLTISRFDTFALYGHMTSECNENINTFYSANIEKIGLGSGTGGGSHDSYSASFSMSFKKFILLEKEYKIYNDLIEKKKLYEQKEKELQSKFFIEVNSLYRTNMIVNNALEEIKKLTEIIQNERNKIEQHLSSKYQIPDNFNYDKDLYKKYEFGLRGW